MGAFIIALAGDTDMTGGTKAQDLAASTLTDVFLAVQAWLSPVPEPVPGLMLLALAAVFVWGTLSRRGGSDTASVRVPALQPVDGHPSLTATTGTPLVPACHGTANEEEVVR